SVVNEICRRYIVAAAGIEDDIDEDEQPGTFTAEFVLTITCDEVRFVDLQAETTFEFQFEDRVEAAVLCVPVDTQEEGNLTISKTYGAQTQAFSYQLDTQD